MSDEYGDAYDYVDHARRPVSVAQDVLVRAVVYARERGGRWGDVAKALNLTADQTAADLDQWCLHHLEKNHGARHNAHHDGIEDHMVSANLPECTLVTEMKA